MKLESFANELLLDLFEYLNVIHLFHAFRGLNSRFDTLLFDHYQAYYLDFRSVSKYDFDIFCQQHLLSIVDQVVSLRLSDDEETPNLPNHFLRYRFTIDQFTRLKSLTLHGLHSETLHTLVSNFHHLSDLTHLKITEITSYFRETNHPHNLINNIWSLPKLTHCHLDITNFSDRLTVISSSIKYLFIKHFPATLRDLADLFEHTHCLQHLSINLDSYSDSVHLSTVAPAITKLNISTDCSPLLLTNIFRNMPNLSHLTIEMMKRSDTICLNGHQWKQMIVDYLPNIKVFRFFTQFYLSDENNINGIVDELLNTFRTPFWLDEHRWFVRCEWDPWAKYEDIYLYTLPHYFGDIYVFNPANQTKSTSPEDRDYRSYNRTYHILSEKQMTNWSLSSVLFPKIVCLQISLPIHDTIWSIIPIFDHLTSLKVSLYNKTGISQLQMLLDRAPRLYSLSVEHIFASQLAQLLNITHAQIRHLSVGHDCFNPPECSLLANSSLGRQCEILSISLTDRRNVLDLLNEMSNLRALTCFCEDNKWDLDESLLSSKKDIVEWFQDKLPSTCSIHKTLSEHSEIQVWFGKGQ